MGHLGVLMSAILGDGGTLLFQVLIQVSWLVFSCGSEMMKHMCLLVWGAWPFHYTGPATRIRMDWGRVSGGGRPCVHRPARGGLRSAAGGGRSAVRGAHSVAGRPSLCGGRRSLCGARRSLCSGRPSLCGGRRSLCGVRRSLCSGEAFALRREALALRREAVAL